MAEVLPDLQVAMISEDQEITGFLPFHANALGVGKPAGMFLNDFQGIICDRPFTSPVKELLDGSNLKSWQFNHLIGSQQALASYQCEENPSPYVSIAKGFESYRIAQRKSGSNSIEQALRKERKLQREQGPLRFIWHTADDAAFASLLDWKDAQHRRTGIREVMRYPWVVDLLDRIRQHPTDEFAGVMCALYAGEQLVAVHLGLRCRHVLHWWIPTYNAEFDGYSPGLLLLMMLIRQSREMGIERIDLGKGHERYKTSMMTGATTVAEGMLSKPGIAASLAGATLRLRHWVRHSPLRETAQLPKRVIRKLEYWIARSRSAK